DPRTDRLLNVVLGAWLGSPAGPPYIAEQVLKSSTGPAATAQALLGQDAKFLDQVLVFVLGAPEGFQVVQTQFLNNLPAGDKPAGAKVLQEVATKVLGKNKGPDAVASSFTDDKASLITVVSGVYKQPTHGVAAVVEAIPEPTLLKVAGELAAQGK